MKLTRFLLLGSLLFVACHDSNPPTTSTMALVSGRVMDDRGQAIPNAAVALIGSSTEVQTDAEGRFIMEVEPGAHEVHARFNDTWLCAACFTVGSTEAMNLGDLYPGREPGCGAPVGCAGDMDCDGLSDEDELAGWQVTIVLGDESILVRQVTSDPTRVDTDGDGLSDLDEMAARTDPRRRDTDGDMLPDFAELFAYKSNPWVVDSDGDSRGPDGTAVSDPNLWDGYELLLTKTSPTLADTDGDGLTDWEEVHSGGTDPLVADLPRMALDLYGDPTLVLNITDVSTSEQSSIYSTLEKDSEGYQKTDTESTKMSIENTVNIHQELTAGTGTWPPSYEAKITTDTEFKHGYATESLASWTEESVRESRNNYEQQTRNITNISYDDGMLWTAVKIVNDSDLSFRVRDLRIAALRMKAGSNFESVGTLTLGRLGQDGWEPFEGAAGEFILGPSVEYIGLVGADRLPAQVMRSLVSNPTALLFEIGSYTMHKLDPFGNPTINFATLGESVIQRTGLIVVDYGNGVVERHMVATNVYRFPDGSGRGVTMKEALELIGIPHETAPHAVQSERRVLTRLGSVEAFIDEADPAVRGFWIVGGTTATFDEPIVQDFDDIVLGGGERINLTFVKDSDGDSIFDAEEYLLGTNPQEPDTDHDNLTDYDESKVGWTVQVQGLRAYAVRSDPRFADYDRDYLQDGAERSLGTDPYDADTDGDGFEDAFDPNPLVPPCMDPTPMLLSAWWDGAVNGNAAIDRWSLDEVSSDGAMFAAGAPGSVAVTLNGEPMFRFNQTGDRIDVPDPPSGSTLLGLSPIHEFSIVSRIHWAGAPPTVPTGTWGTVLTKGPRNTGTYAISIQDSGALRFSVYRRVWEHRYGWLFGWVDNLAADIRRNELTQVVLPTHLQPNEWVHVVTTFGRDWMSIYLNGELAHRVDMDYWQTSGTIRTHYTTEYLRSNAEPLRIADDLGTSPEGRFNGYLDDIQYFHRALTATEARQLFELGNCRPNGG